MKKKRSGGSRTLSRGSHTPVRFLLRPLKLVTLFGIVLIIFMFLKKRIFSNKAKEVYDCFLRLGFGPGLAAFATAAAGHETAGFSSLIFLLNNNAFGMKYAGQALARGEKNGYAYYSSLEDSIKDFIKWYNVKRGSVLSFPLFINGLDKFVRFLKVNSYFEADENQYLKGCQYFYNLYFGN